MIKTNFSNRNINKKENNNNKNLQLKIKNNNCIHNFFIK